MNENTPDPFELIRREATPAEPSEEDVYRARQRLQAAILGEREKEVRRRVRPWLIPALAVLVMLLVVGGIGLFRSTPAEAALGEIAKAARAATPLEVPQGSFIYTRSERVDLAIRPGSEFGADEDFVSYLLPSIREVWRQPETEFIQIGITNQPPTFFDPTLEDIYYRQGLDTIDRLGETQTEQLTGVTDLLLDVEWPTEPDALHQALRDYADQGGDDHPGDVQIFDLATDLLREADRTPELRAALIEVLAQLPVEIEKRTNEGITLGIKYAVPFPTHDTITLSHDGDLLAETRTLIEGDPELGVPEGTMILEVHYSGTRVTDDL